MDFPSQSLNSHPKQNKESSTNTEKRKDRRSRKQRLNSSRKDFRNGMGYRKMNRNRIQDQTSWPNCQSCSSRMRYCGKDYSSNFPSCYCSLRFGIHRKNLNCNRHQGLHYAESLLNLSMIHRNNHNLQSEYWAVVGPYGSRDCNCEGFSFPHPDFPTLLLLLHWMSYHRGRHIRRRLRQCTA